MNELSIQQWQSLQIQVKKITKGLQVLSKKKEKTDQQQWRSANQRAKEKQWCKKAATLDSYLSQKMNSL